MRILLVDNHDSFTYNLFQLLAAHCGVEPTVVFNDDPAAQTLDLDDFDAVVISPGPGRPENKRDVGFSRDVLDIARIPILGVCLGHQLICHHYGAKIVHAPGGVVHGRVSNVFHDGDDLFAGIPIPFEAVRYHSLSVEELPALIERTAVTQDKTAMAVRHVDKPIWGVQFHPESISAQYGEQLIKNFCEMAARWLQAEGREIHTTPFELDDRVSRDVAPDANEISWRRLDIWAEPSDCYQRLFAESSPSYWLDSATRGNAASRFSFMGDASGDGETLSYDTSSQTIKRCANGVIETINESIFAYLERCLSERRVTNAALPFDFTLGYVGYLGYELKNECGGNLVHQSTTPDAFLIYTDRLIAFDHLEQCVYLVARKDSADEWFDETEQQLINLSQTAAPTPATPATAAPATPATPANSGQIATAPMDHGHLTDLYELRHSDLFELRHSQQQYIDLIEQCQQEIHEGESYEICLTNMITAPPLEDPLSTYIELRETNPAPFASFLRLPDVAVLSSSPERFLSIDAAGVVEAKPIKGTMPRGETTEADDALKSQLRSSEKDRAENRMIVDLLRNDLGSVCEIGSIDVPKIFDVETYATLHQLVSTVTGRLDPSTSSVACVKAAFPGGSMTGAPKVRTMEILDRLEAGPRGIYSGAIGYFSLNGAVDLSIVIRTIVSTSEEATIGVGGAITSLSDPQREFEESMLKGQALLDVLR